MGIQKVNRKVLRLKSNDRVAIVGAGPSGTLCAKFLLEYAKEKGIRLNIVIFDGKKFSSHGPRGCNMCAGVISESLLKRLGSAGIELPDRLIQKRIKGYKLYTQLGSLPLYSPKGEERIVTVYRGSGPVDCNYPSDVSFDNFLLEHVINLGAKVIQEPVTDIELTKDGPVTLRYGRDERCDSSEAECVVVACGLNSGLPDRLRNLGFGYRPPKMISASQIELKTSPEFIAKNFQDMIHGYLLNLPRIRFASIVPKSEHLTITVIGTEDMKKQDVWNFIRYLSRIKAVPQDLRTPSEHCHCHPRLALSGAENPFTDRLVVVGDASYSRYYKNGLESAFLTAQWAATTIIESGISKEAFKTGYLKRCKKIIGSDNRYGQMVFRLNDIIARSKLITGLHQNYAERERALNKPLRLNRVLWNIFTGGETYKRIFFQILNPALQLSMLAYTLRSFLTYPVTLKGLKQRMGLGPLADGSTVVIIGGGPAGASCAVALKRGAAKLNRNINVIIYEPKDFDVVQNQCVGVLSPPFEEVLRDKLGMALPEEIVQRRITSYVLHATNSEVELSGEDKLGPTYSTRRKDLDKLLLDEAKRLGVEVIDRGIQEIEFFPEFIRIFSGQTNHQADCVVGAFGVDAGCLELLESYTPYRRPKFLRSVITNIYAENNFIEERLKNNIHVFLMPIKNIEFAAITPKTDHITVNVCGKKVSSKDMDEFLSHPNVKGYLPPYKNLIYYKGSFPISPARHLHQDRFVCVGDAGGLIRPLKGKGINSAILTGARAAQTMLETGISKEAFHRYYQMCHDLIDDAHYGKALRYLCNLSLRLNLLDALVELSKKDLLLYRAFYNIVSGHETYTNIVKQSLDIKFAFRLAFALAKGALSNLMPKARV